MFCKQCGKEIESGKKFCSNCGAAVLGQTSVQPYQAAQYQTTPTKSKQFKFVSSFPVWIALLLVVVGIAGGFFMGKKGKSGEMAGTGVIEKILPGKTKEEMLVGKWEDASNAQVTFKKDGHVRFGIPGISLGGDFITYELIGDNLISVSGGKLPFSVDIPCSISENELTLEIYDKEYTFYKE